MRSVLRIAVVTATMLFIVLCMSGCSHRTRFGSSSFAPALDFNSDFPELRGIESNRLRQAAVDRYLEQNLKYIEDDLRDIPYMAESNLLPAKQEILDLQKMSVVDKDFAEKFNQLHSDLQAIFRMEAMPIT